MIEAPRDELLSFACDMEHELRNNDHKEGWHHLSDRRLMNRINQKLKELKRAIKKGGNTEVIGEAADVANFLMMLADNHK